VLGSGEEILRHRIVVAQQHRHDRRQPRSSTRVERVHEPAAARPEPLDVEPVRAVERVLGVEPEHERAAGLVRLDDIADTPVPAPGPHVQATVEVHRRGRPSLDGPEPTALVPERVEQRSDGGRRSGDVPAVDPVQTHVARSVRS